MGGPSGMNIGQTGGPIAGGLIPAGPGMGLGAMPSPMHPLAQAAMMQGGMNYMRMMGVSGPGSGR